MKAGCPTVKANYSLNCLSQCNTSHAALKQLWLAVSKLVFKSTDKITHISYFFSENKIRLSALNEMLYNVKGFAMR